VISTLPGLHLDKKVEKLSPKYTVIALGIFREILGIDIENARSILGALPQQIPFSDIVGYQNTRRLKEGLPEDTTLEQAIEIAEQAKKKLDAIPEYQSEVVLPEGKGHIDPFLAELVTNIINGQVHGRPIVVALRGGSGIGKTAMIRQASKMADIDDEFVGYFSVPTLQPEDFAGIPSPDPKDPQTFYYRMPKGLNKFKVLVLDETNRAHPKVANALLQLMAEGAINGLRFDDLQAIFLAWNPPEDGEFSGVEDMDEAFIERIDHFHDLKAKYNARVIGEEIGNHVIAEIGVKWVSELGEATRDQLNPRRLAKILRAYTMGENIHTTVDKRRTTIPLEKLEQMLKAEDILTLEQLISDPDKVEAMMLAGGAKAHDVSYRFNELVRVMWKKGMREDFVRVAHLFRHIRRDQIPRPDRERGLWGFIEQSMKKHATPTESAAFFDVLKERARGRDSIASELAQIGQNLRASQGEEDNQAV
jgi:hypothetical protein